MWIQSFSVLCFPALEWTWRIVKIRLYFNVIDHKMEKWAINIPYIGLGYSIQQRKSYLTGGMISLNLIITGSLVWQFSKLFYSDVLILKFNMFKVFLTCRGWSGNFILTCNWYGFLKECWCYCCLPQCNDWLLYEIHSYRSQSFDLSCKSNDSFLYEIQCCGEMG